MNEPSWSGGCAVAQSDSEDARRARVILMLADGASYSTIERALPCFRDYINRWRRRFLAKRLPGLESRHHSPPLSVLTTEMEARILEKTRQRPPDGSTHWSTRKLARLLQINHNHVANAWRRAGLQPHRFERYMQSDDPDFERKAADVIGLYVNPPQHAAIFCRRRKDRDSSPRPPRSRVAALARARGAARLRVLPARDTLVVCGLEHPNRRSGRPDGPASYERRLCRLLA